MDLCSQFCSSVQPASQLASAQLSGSPTIQMPALYGQNFNVGHDRQTDHTVHHLIPLSVVLTSAESHKILGKQSLLASFFAHFSADQDDMWLVLK